MACLKTVSVLLAISASMYCTPSKRSVLISTSREDSNDTIERQPPPYHQSPVNGTEKQNHTHLHHRQDNAEVHRHGYSLNSYLNRNGSSKPPTPQILPANHSQRNHSRLETLGSNASYSMPNYGQTPKDLEKRNISIPQKQFFEVYNNTFFISIVLVPQTQSQRVGLPDQAITEVTTTARNSTQVRRSRDKMFSLMNSFKQSIFGAFLQHANRSVEIGCNFTTQAGYSCFGCRTQLVCNRNNIGTTRTCPRNAPYCYKGVCGSFVDTTACATTTG